MKNRLKVRLFAIGAIVMWSTAASAFKISLRFGSPFSIVFTASAVSLCIYSISVILSLCRGKRKLSIDPAAFAGGAVRGLLNPFLYYLILLEAYHRLMAQTAMVINYLWPVTLVLLSIPLLGQKIRPAGVLAIMLSFSGVAVMGLLGGEGRPGGSADLIGIVLALVSTIVWSLFWLLNVRDKREHDLKLFLDFLFGMIYLSLYGVLTGSFGHVGIEAIAGGVYIGIFEMGFAFILWMKALTLASSTAEVSNLVFLTPFLALALVGIVVGERIGPATVAGLILVVAGILMQRGLGSLDRKRL